MQESHVLRNAAVTMALYVLCEQCLCLCARCVYPRIRHSISCAVLEITPAAVFWHVTFPIIGILAWVCRAYQQAPTKHTECLDVHIDLYACMDDTIKEMDRDAVHVILQYWVGASMQECMSTCVHKCNQSRAYTPQKISFFYKAESAVKLAAEQGSNIIFY